MEIFRFRWLLLQILGSKWRVCVVWYVLRNVCWEDFMESIPGNVLVKRFPGIYRCKLGKKRFPGIYRCKFGEMKLVGIYRVRKLVVNKFINLRASKQTSLRLPLLVLLEGNRLTSRLHQILRNLLWVFCTNGLKHIPGICNQGYNQQVQNFLLDIFDIMPR